MPPAPTAVVFCAACDLAIHAPRFLGEKMFFARSANGVVLQAVQSVVVGTTEGATAVVLRSLLRRQAHDRPGSRCRHVQGL